MIYRKLQKRSNDFFPQQYFWSLTIFLIAELMFAIACIIFPWKSREIIEHLLSKRLIEEYRESQNTQNFVDFLQTEVLVYLYGLNILSLCLIIFFLFSLFFANLSFQPAKISLLSLDEQYVSKPSDAWMACMLHTLSTTFLVLLILFTH